MQVKPLRENVLIKRVEEENKTAGGIILPDTAKEKPSEGIVIAAGEGPRTPGRQNAADERQGRRPYSVQQVVGNGSQN